MGLEVVVNEIIEEGRKRAAAIEKEGLEEAKAILQEAKAKSEAILSEREALAQRDAARIRTQETARADFDAKKKVLVAKRALWDRLRQEALDALTHLDETRRRELLNTLIARAEREIPSGVAHVRPEDVGLIRGPYEVQGDLDALGGVVVEDETGSVSIDQRFESILDEVWPQVLKEESKKLFG